MEPIATPAFSPPSSAPLPVETAPVSASRKCVDRAIVWCGRVGGLVLFLVFLLIAIVIPHVFRIDCPYANGKRCNGKGTCNDAALCECEILYSGSACTDNQVPGYVARQDEENLECNGNGFANPFISVPAECQTRYSNGEAIQGTGWGSAECASFVQSQRGILGNSPPELFPNISTKIPICFCYVGYIGPECLFSPCPVDYSGLTCAGNGNTSVGLIQNFTNAGNGCQCKSVVALYQYRSYFSDAGLEEIRQFYARDFNYRVYCGEVYSVRNSTGGIELDRLVFSSTTDDYKCYCDSDWTGRACTNNKCPYNRNTKKVCNGHGAPQLGQGRLVNTTIANFTNGACDVICKDGFDLCTAQKNRCIYSQGVNEQLFDPGVLCQNPLQCPFNAPLRAYTGGCYRIPSSIGGSAPQCFNGYQQAVIDYAQFNQTVQLTKCPNITSYVEFQQCFRNLTAITGVEGYYNRSGGGVYFNGTGTSFVVDYGSPLIYFQFESTGAATLRNWDGQVFEFPSAGFHSGALSYETEGEWLPRTIEYPLTLSRLSEDLYSLFPIQIFNYSVLELFDPNVTYVRVVNTPRQVTYVLDTVNSNVEIVPYTPTVASRFPNNGLLLRAPFNSATEQQEVWYFPFNGSVVSKATCLGNAELCAWYYDNQTGEVRNLEGTVWVCNTTTYLSPTACAFSIEDYYLQVDAFVWYTSIQAQSRVALTAVVAQFDQLFTNLSQANRFTDFSLTFVGEQNASVFLTSPSFVTLDTIHYDCVVPPSDLTVNQSILNERWWGQSAQRAVVLSQVDLDTDFFLGAVFSQGEKTLHRSKAIRVNEAAQTMLLEDIHTLVQYSAHVRDVRKIAPLEVLEGWAQADTIMQPFRCPDGSPSDMTSIQSDIPASCNCSYSAPIALCNCTDLTEIKYGCECDLSIPDCECGLPAGYFFQQDLLGRLLGLTTDACECLFFTPTAEELTNSTQTVYGVQNSSVILVQSLTQMPTHFIFASNGSSDCNNQSLTIDLGSILFFNLTDPVNYTAYSEDLGGGDCEYWVTIYPDQFLATTYYNLTITNGGLLDWVTVLYSTYGVGLMQTSDIPTFTASSNSELAPNVNVLNSSYWISSGNLREYPVWIKASFEYQHYLSYMRVVFYEAGTIAGSNTEIPLQVQLQGFNSVGWTALAQFGVYVESGGWKEVLVNISTGNLTFSAFRLITPAGRMGIRQWELFTNQDCYCDNGTWLSMNTASFDGLVSLDDTLAEIDFWNAHVGSQSQCVCENNCTVHISSSGENVNVANDGICQDVIFQSSQLDIPLTLAPNGTNTTTYVAEEGTLTALFSYEIAPGWSSVQFSNDSNFMTTEEQLTYVNQSVAATGIVVSSWNIENLDDNFFLLNTTTLEVLYSQFVNSEVNVTTTTYENGTFTFDSAYFLYDWGILTSAGAACAAGYDCNDCGPVRDLPLLPGLTCSLTPFQASIAGRLASGDVFVNRTYYMSNMTQLTDTWFATFQNINFTRAQAQVNLAHCEEQVCPVTLPYMCKNGTCVAYPSQCADRYMCPGNGCVRITDGALGDVGELFACACAAGFGGPGCEFGRCLPATPLLLPILGGTPLGEECSVDPPLTQVTYSLNDPLVIAGSVTNAQIEVMNNRTSGVIAQRSNQDIGPKNVKWLHNPFGRKILRKVVRQVPGFDPTTFYTTCPFYRKGFNGEKNTMLDDTLTVNFTTGERTWRSGVNPINGEFVVFQWYNFTTYDDFPWRCANGICVESQAYCAQSESQFEICNGRGWGRADGSCECYAGWRTLSINSEIGSKIAYPYPVIDNVTQPTIMTIDDTWRHWALTQCTARDCDVQNCNNLLACYQGDSDVGFVDKLVACPVGTGREGLCAPTISECTTGTNIQTQLVCAGNGIPRTKDITGEKYCHCGSPVSPLLNITAVTQITQLTPNGWGGLLCSDYYAPRLPIVYSRYNFELDLPYRSLITGEVLPGMWLSGKVPVGPDPSDRLLWQQCCPNVTRLELCNCVPCEVASDRGRIQFIQPEQCIAIGRPLVYYCNNHGVARADGSCECDVNEADGSGYTYDLTQFSVKGCFKFVQCPISPINDAPCHRVNPLASPEEWLHPLPKDEFLEQQWITCGLDGQGMISNITRMEAISVNLPDYQTLIQESLGQTAIEVISAIDGLDACICVYPNDTLTEKCCMLPGVELQYEQNFNSPYLLTGEVPGESILTDGSLEALRAIAPYAEFDTTFTFRLFVNNETYISAIRMYAAAPNGTVISSYNSDGDPVCADGPVQGNNGSLFGWDFGDGSGATQCGPTYTCQNTRLFPDYLQNCEFDKDSARCLQWKRAQCIAENVNNVYWPPDSGNTYMGCERSGDPDGCQCCQRDLLSQLAPVTDGVITFEIIEGGPLYINQIQVYGYTNRTLTPSEALQSGVNRASGQNGSLCHDELYYRATLGPDNSYYIPLDQTPETGLFDTQRPRTRVDAQTRCNETGGWLGVTDNFVDQSDVDALVNECGTLGASVKCMVGARDNVYHADRVTREELFNTDVCNRTMGCYVPLRMAQAGTLQITNAYTFSNYDPTNTTYTTPVIADQWPASQFQTDQDYYDYVPSAPCTVVFVLLNSEVVTFQLNNMAQYARGIDLRRYGRGVVANLWKVMFTDPAECAVIALHPPEALTSQEYVRNQGNRNNIEGGPRILFTPSGYENPTLSLAQFVYPYGPSGVQSKLVSYEYCYRRLPGCDNGRTLVTSRFPALKIYPTQWAVRRLLIQPMYNTLPKGFVGRDWAPGTLAYPYRPLFFRFTTVEVIDPIIGPTDFRFSAPLVVPDETTPVYLKQSGSVASLNLCPNITLCVVEADIPLCSACLATLRGRMEWDTRIYSVSVWRNTIDDYPTPEIHVRGSLLTPTDTEGVQVTAPNRQFSLLGISSDHYLPISVLIEPITGFVNNIVYYMPQTYAHQINYIESITERPNPPYVEWSINNCVIVGPGGLELEVCENVVRNFICQYDFTKYVVVPGYQCPDCGPDLKRPSGVPLPGRTCNESFPLANPSEFPFEHRVKDEYLRGTLARFAQSFNLQPNTTEDFRNMSVIWGFEQAWLKWKQCFSSQPGQSTRGVLPNVNWCNMCPSIIWPVDCGVRRNPYTNVREHRLATSIEFCDPLLVNFTVSPMNNQTIPALLFPVLEINSYETSSCGINIPLRSYYRQDKYGGIQSDLALGQQIIKVEFEYVEIETTDVSTPLKWYNAGKAPQPYTFQWDQTASIHGSYILNNCGSCSDPVLEVYVHPLDPGYVPPTNYISVFVSLVNTSPGDPLESYLVNFTITSAETGIETIEGEEFPLVVFQGVGYRVHNLTAGSTFALINPVITNEETRNSCISRPVPDWKEPLNAIKSTAPLRQCIISIKDQDENPGAVPGECQCDLSTDGTSCSVAATISKYGKSGCGGFGQPGATAIAPNGQRFLTGEMGSYTWDGHMDCKTFDLGRTSWTTVIPGAVWEYKSVYPPKAPRNGQPVFSLPSNRLAEQLSVSDVELDCTLAQSQLAYYYTADELTQLLRLTRNIYPVFMSVDIADSTEGSFPWQSPVDGALFDNNANPVEIGAFGSCGSDASLCAKINFNNYVYGKAPAALTDGDTNTLVGTLAQGDLDWYAGPPSQGTSVQVWVFLSSTETLDLITCTEAGSCGTGVQIGFNFNQYYDCNCATRSIHYEASDFYTEIQVFGLFDLSRSQFYIYGN